MPKDTIKDGKIVNQTPTNLGGNGESNSLQGRISPNTDPIPNYNGSSIQGNFTQGNNTQSGPLQSMNSGANSSINVDGKQLPTNEGIAPFSRSNDVGKLDKLSGADLQDLMREKVKPLDTSKLSTSRTEFNNKDYSQQLDQALKNSPKLEDEGGGNQPPDTPTYTGGGSAENNNNNDPFKKFYTLASLISSGWAFFVNLMIFLIIFSLLTAMVIGLTTMFLDGMCGAAEKVPGWVKPDKLEELCNTYKKIRRGCYVKEDGTKEAKKPDTDAGGLANIDCIGEALLKDNNPDIKLFGISGPITVKKDFIKEIIVAGTKAGVKTDIIKMVISMFPIITPTNAWKEISIGGCYGIMQLCDGTIALQNNSAYREAIIGLEVKDVVEYQNNPELQMKSIKNLIEKRETDFRSAPKCVETAVLNKSDTWRKAFLFNKLECDGDSTIPSLTKSEFANRVEKNFNALGCNQFKEYFNKTKETADNTNYEDRAYVESPILQLNHKQLVNNWKNGLAVISEAQFANIRSDECVEAKKYKNKLEEASKKYSNRFLQLSPSLLAGIFSRETHWTLLIGGCAGYGDGGNGHGIGQADPTGNKALTGRYSAPGIKVSPDIKSSADTLEPKINKEYTSNDSYVWSDCNEGIMYAAGHLVEMQHYAHDIIIEKLRAANMNMDADDNGFKDFKTKKAYIQAVLISNNRGQGGLYTSSCSFDSSTKLFREGCTAAGPSGSGDYGTDIFKRAADLAKCMGYDSSETAILSADSKSTGDGTNTDCEVGSVGSTTVGDGDFPLITKKGSGVYIRFTAGYPFYPGGTPHSGTDWGPEPNEGNTSRVISISDGEIIADYPLWSKSCSANCDERYQRHVKVKGTDGRDFSYVHLDLSPATAFKKKGDKVKKGDVIGQLDKSPEFTHLHFMVYVNGVTVQPLDHLKGLPAGFKPSPFFIQENQVPKSLHEKLP